MRYTYEYKRKCVELYREGKWPETPEGVSNKSFRDKVRLWVRAEDSRGPEALKHKNFNRNWTPEERLELVSQVMSGKSCVSVAIEAGIQDRLLYQWVQNYKTKGYNGLVEMKKGRPSKGVPQMKKEEIFLRHWYISSQNISYGPRETQKQIAHFYRPLTVRTLFSPLNFPNS